MGAMTDASTMKHRTWCFMNELVAKTQPVIFTHGSCPNPIGSGPPLAGTESRIRLTDKLVATIAHHLTQKEYKAAMKSLIDCFMDDIIDQMLMEADLKQEPESG